MISTFRSVTRHARRVPAQQRRRFALGGSSGPPPEWEGVDKVVRGYFPQDYQLAIAILSGYGGLYVLYKISSLFSSKKPVEEAKPVAVASTPTTGIPAVDTPAFATFLETSAFEQLLENEDQLSKALESA